MKNLLKKLVGFISKKTGYQVTVIKKGLGTTLGNTAVKSADGFWYVGNVFDSHDIAYGIVANGKVEPEDHDLIVSIAKKLLDSKKDNVVVYDIGANTGYYGMVTANINKERIQTYSFEPLPDHTDCIKETIKINDFKQSIVKEYALGEKNEVMKIFVAGSGSSFNSDFIGNNPTETVEVAIKKLDDVIQSENLTKPDFIKIDVEGHELQVLKGALTTLKETKPILFIEIVHNLEQNGINFKNDQFESTFTFLKNLGYQAFTNKQGAIVPYSTSDKVTGLQMYLFIHEQSHASLAKSLLS